jgi:hypothetical protein
MTALDRDRRLPAIDAAGQACPAPLVEEQRVIWATGRAASCPAP